MDTEAYVALFWLIEEGEDVGVVEFEGVDEEIGELFAGGGAGLGFEHRKVKL